MGAYLALLATIFAGIQQRESARNAEIDRHNLAKKQQRFDIQMQMAHQLAPDIPAYGAEAAQFNSNEALANKAANSRMDEQKRQMYASILPAAVSAFGNAWGGSGSDPSSSAYDGQILNKFDTNSAPLPYQNDDASQLRWS